MPKVEFKRVQTDAEVENIDIKDGQLIYSKSGKTYMDYGSERIATGSGGGSIDVDTEMSDTSENAVQNKVIKEYVDDQIEISNTEPTSENNKLWIDTGEVQNSGSELPLVYPVGSIYMSVNNTNPATLFGFGTWEQIQDTFLLAAGTTYTAGDTGGSATHTLTVDEMPSHNHVMKGFSYMPSEGGSIEVLSRNIRPTEYGKATTDVGGGQAFSTMPPYLVVYMWKRTA